MFEWLITGGLNVLRNRRLKCRVGLHGDLATAAPLRCRSRGFAVADYNISTGTQNSG